MSYLAARRKNGDEQHESIKKDMLTRDEFLFCEKLSLTTKAADVFRFQNVA